MSASEIAFGVFIVVGFVLIARYVDLWLDKRQTLFSLRYGDEVQWIDDGNLRNGSFITWTPSGLASVAGSDGPTLIDAKIMQKRLR